jgi:hypothetical protein
MHVLEVCNNFLSYVNYVIKKPLAAFVSQTKTNKILQTSKLDQTSHLISVYRVLPKKLNTVDSARYN